jgi:hypothetical protein
MIDGAAPAGLLSSTVPFTMLLAVGIPPFVFDLLALWAWVRASVQAHNTAVELGSTKKHLQEYKQVYTIGKMQQLDEYSQQDNTPAAQLERGGSGTSSASETPSGAASRCHREVAANGEKGKGMFLWPA